MNGKAHNGLVGAHTSAATANGAELLAAATGNGTYDPSAWFVEATVKVKVGGQIFHTAAEGNGPVNALDLACARRSYSSTL